MGERERERERGGGGCRHHFTQWDNQTGPSRCATVFLGVYLSGVRERERERERWLIE